jgi:hypothetical protein
MHNFQRDGIHRMDVGKGRVAYEPNTLDASGPRENPHRGFATFASKESGGKLRVRPESFADHYSQARLFFRSMSEPEKRHIVSAFAFELGKVETMAIRTRMLGHLMIVDRDLGSKVEEALGMKGEAAALTPARQPSDMAPSPALSMIKKAPATLKTRKIAVLVSDGVDAALIARLRQALEKEGAELAVGCVKNRWRPNQRRRSACSRSRALRGAVHLFRCRSPLPFARGCAAARDGGGSNRLAARCVRSPEDHRLHYGRGTPLCSGRHRHQSR